MRSVLLYSMLTVLLAGRAVATGGATRVAMQDTSARLAFTVQPSNTKAGEPFSPAVQVMAQDAAGETMTSFIGPVTLAITDETGNEESELLGRATVAAVAGVATFPGLSIDSAGTGYTLTATAEGLADGVSSAFDVTPGAVAKLALRAGTLTGTVTLDGRLDELAWSSADSIVNLTTIEPV